MSIIKIFNDGINWIAIIDEVEHRLSEIIINTNSRTIKNYITVKSSNYKIHNGILTIN